MDAAALAAWYKGSRSSATWVDGKAGHRVVRDVSACHIDYFAVSSIISFKAAFSCLF